MMSAQGLKKAIERNERLSKENSRLEDQLKKMKVIASRGKMAIHGVKEAEDRARKLNNEAMKLTEDLNFFKEQHQMRKFSFASMEEVLVETALNDLVLRDTGSTVGQFLVANMNNDSCRRLLHLSQSLRPSTQRALFLAAQIKTLEENNRQLQIRLSVAQGEVILLSDEIGRLLEDKEDSSPDPDFARKPPASSSSVKLRQNKRPWESLKSED
ncbi:uncharacterized protein LOC111454550 [Cucurbita moschata]|uniref:Uncharacterized protein LOC111454550 n=1 Tax=Cucurbita moschata TaxID=3662 RepID=A0A6J1GIQ2_CUCMO|nr:uncharacterized protein LOC111454550 [Cucurbita moschata]